MGLPRATVSDPADIRELDCLLPRDTPASCLALQIADLLRFPLIGPDNRPLNYGLVPKGGDALDPRRALDAPGDRGILRLRVVPHVVIGGTESDIPQADAGGSSVHPSDSRVVAVGEQRILPQDENLDLRPDVRIDAEVHREIGRFAAEDRYAECAGLLLGQVFTEDSQRVIYVTAAIPAPDAPASRTSVELTVEAWASMLRERDVIYPHLRVLGWFHTHAGWGVFLSDSDLFLHRHFFANPNMVAYVLDPTTGRDGFFFWHNGSIGPCPSYALVGSPERISRRSGKRTRRRLRSATLAAGAVLGALLYFGIAGPHFVGIGERDVVPPARPVTAERSSSGAESGAAATRVYVLGKGDNLWRLCNQFYGEGDLAGPLAGYNGISDFTHLQVGQEIKLPPKDVLVRLRDTRPLRLRQPSRPE